MLTNPVVGQLVRFTRDALHTFTSNTSRLSLNADSHAISKVEHRPGSSPLIELENEDKFDSYWIEEVPGPHTQVVLITSLEPDWEEVKRQHAEKVKFIKREE